MRREDGQALIKTSLAFSLTTDETAIAFVLIFCVYSKYKSFKSQIIPDDAKLLP